MDELVYGDYQQQKLTTDDRGSEHDSEDSNRESNEGHEYPEEDSDFDGEDEEAAAARYNEKETRKLNNRILDSLKSESYVPKMPMHVEGYDEDDDMVD